MPVSLKAIRPKRFRLIDPTVTRREAAKAIETYLKEVRDKLNEGYSTVPPSPRYARTKRLRRGWKIQSGFGNYGILTNDARDNKGRPYAAYVIGPRGGGRVNTPGFAQRQADRMRRKGWLSISDVARETRPRFAQLANRAIGPNINSFDR